MLLLLLLLLLFLAAVAVVAVVVVVLFWLQIGSIPGQAINETFIRWTIN